VCLVTCCSLISGSSAKCCLQAPHSFEPFCFPKVILQQISNCTKRPFFRLEGACRSTGWGIKVSHFSKGHCEGCSGGREVGVVSCGLLASTVVSNHNGLDR